MGQQHCRRRHRLDCVHAVDLRRPLHLRRLHEDRRPRRSGRAQITGTDGTGIDSSGQDTCLHGGVRGGPFAGRADVPGHAATVVRGPALGRAPRHELFAHRGRGVPHVSLSQDLGRRLGPLLQRTGTRSLRAGGRAGIPVDLAALPQRPFGERGTSGRLRHLAPVRHDAQLGLAAPGAAVLPGPWPGAGGFPNSKPGAFGRDALVIQFPAVRAAVHDSTSRQGTGEERQRRDLGRKTGVAGFDLDGRARILVPAAKVRQGDGLAQSGRKH